jgi:hypothetical protein
MTPADIGWDNDLWGEENPGSSLGLSMFLFCIFFDFWGMGGARMDRVRMDRVRTDRVRMDRVRMDRVRMDRVRMDRVRMDRVRMDSEGFFFITSTSR